MNAPQEAYYFGCSNGSTGHYLHDASMTKTRSFDMKETPFGITLDTGLLNKARQQIQREAVLVQKRGWTALSFWDRSVDKRSGSNSAFVAKGDKTFDEMLEIAAGQFPTVFNRFKFSIMLAEPKTIA